MTIREMVLEETKTPDELMTKHMLLLERRHRLPIRILIAPVPGTGAKYISNWLGIAESTLSEWRKRFGMEDVRTLKPGPKSTQKG